MKFLYTAADIAFRAHIDASDHLAAYGFQKNA